MGEGKKKPKILLFDEITLFLTKTFFLPTKKQKGFDLFFPPSPKQTKYSQNTLSKKIPSLCKTCVHFPQTPKKIA